MEYTIRAIETEYRGCLFRSRLEARWAAFFDLAGIGWDYEPMDLAGWSPDFLLHRRRWDTLPEEQDLCEVKPIVGPDVPPDVVAKIESAMDLSVDTSSNCNVFVCGVGPIVTAHGVAMCHWARRHDGVWKWQKMYPNIKGMEYLWALAGRAVRFRYDLRKEKPPPGGPTGAGEAKGGRRVR